MYGGRYLVIDTNKGLKYYDYRKININHKHSFFLYPQALALPLSNSDNNNENLRQ